MAEVCLARLEAVFIGLIVGDTGKELSSEWDDFCELRREE
jgi:hypothetical protein